MKNFSELVENLKESVEKEAEKYIDSLKKKGKKDREIIKMVHSKFSSLSSVDILSMMESSIKANLYSEMERSDQESIGEGVYAFIPDRESKKKYYFEGSISYIDSFLLNEEGINEEIKCSICGCSDHFPEDCDNIEKICKTHSKKIEEYCNFLRPVLFENERATNQDVLDFLSSLQKAKKENKDKTFVYKEETYSISEQSGILKNLFREEKDILVYGECHGKVYKVKGENYPKGVSLVKLNNFKRTDQ